MSSTNSPIPYVYEPDENDPGEKALREQLLRHLEAGRKVGTHSLNQQQSHQSEVRKSFTSMHRHLGKARQEFCDAHEITHTSLFFQAEEQKDQGNTLVRIEAKIDELKLMLRQPSAPDTIEIPREESHFTEEVDED